MQTLNFTPRPLRQRRFLSFLFPLFALFVGMGASQSVFGQAGINRSSVTLSGTSTSGPVGPTTYYGAGANTAAMPPRQPFQDQTLGDFNLSSGQLNITNALTRVTGKAPSETLANTGTFRYRVYVTGATAPGFTNVVLPYVSGTGASTADPAVYSANTSINLISGLISGGTYTVEIRYEVAVIADSDPEGNGPRTLGDPGTSGYTATFTVPPPATTPPGGTTTWISQSSTNWLDPLNWSNGVPTRFASAIIPEKTTSNTNTVTPVLNLQTPDLYEVLTLTLNGATNSTRALLRVGPTTGGGSQGATLNVYGDINNYSAGILAPAISNPGVADPNGNSSIFLRGGNQVIRGVLNIADLRVDGSGVKAIVNTINVNNTLVFAPGVSAIMRTVTEIPGPGGMNTFPLNTTQTSNVQLNGTLVSENSSASSETNTAYIEGVTIAQRTQLTAGQKYTYGNIGLDITTNNPVNTLTTITRTVGDPLNAPTFPGRTPYPVKRQYGVSGDVNNAPNVSTIIFHYLDSANELNGNTDENQLVIFRATNNGPPYALVGGTPNVAENTVTKIGVTNINTITLGSKNNPLPVTLASFDAKRIGEDALVYWTSAQEMNSKGYNVQVSTNGKDYKTLAFVASETPNSNSARSYSFTDTEKNKVGVRYYRLQQLDIDGKSSYITPRTITFEGKATASGLAAYPNPYTNDLRVSLSSAVSGNAFVRITDMTGRLISQQVLPVNIGANDLPVQNMSSLKNGLYLLNLTLPSGESKTMKVVKQ